MLADAVRSETWRLLHNRTAVFWSVFFVPIMSLVIAGVTYAVMKANEAKILESNLSLPDMAGTLDIGRSLAEGAGDLANPAVLLFMLIGAATLYAGDYRWETWRLISARNSRPNLIFGKVLTFAGMALVALAALLLANLLSDLLKALIFARPLGFSFDADTARRLAGFTALSWLRVVQFTMVALLAAVMSRSLLAALFVPLVLGVAQAFAVQLVAPMGFTPDSWLSQMLNPGLGFDALKAGLEGGTAAALAGSDALWKGVVSLTFWTVAPLAGAVAWFSRQDLSKE